MAAVITKELLRVLFRPRFRTVAAAGAGMAVAMLLPSDVTSAPSTGRIIGRVVVTAAASSPLAAATYSSRRVERASTDSPNELGNVVVFVQDAPRGAWMSTTRARIAQQGERFVPQVVAITRGSVVDFPNADPYFHDVFSLSRAATFDLGSYPRGSSRSWQFPRAGIVKVYCHLHSHMSASILVFDHPYFATPQADGTFALDDLPAGTYQVSAWHERIGENTQPVRVDAGRAADVEFSLPVATR